MDTSQLITEALERSISYEEYRSQVDSLFAQGKTTGLDQSESMLRYTELNINRMNKWDKHFKFSETIAERLRSYQAAEIWLVITEAWCGDAAHSVPVMAKMAALAPKVELRLVLRDENPALMEAFLTNGAKAIPKLIQLEADTLAVRNTWGARPKVAQENFLAGKAGGEDPAELKKQMQIWYSRDRGQAIAEEISQILR